MNTTPLCDRAANPARSIFSIGRARLLATTAAAGFILSAGANDAASATCTVNAAGGAQFTTIQAAVNDTTCSEINVAAGTYNEHVTIARDVTITGAAAASTIVDGTNNGRVFTINSGIVSLNDLTVQHGKAPDGSGFSGGSNAAAGQPGGGILNAGTLAITRVIVRENQSGKGANAANLTTCAPNGFCNTRGGSGGDGGGINSSGPLTVTACAFINNAAGAGGAAGTVACGSGTTCSSSAGDAGDGGALEFDEPAQCTITATSFTNNSGYDGGAINQDAAVLAISDSQFTGNSSTNAGGAVNCNSGTKACTIERSTFASNSSAGPFGGGALSFFNNGTKTLTNCTIANNNATNSGGGIFARSGPVSLNFVTVVGNRSDSDNNGSGNGGGLAGDGAALTVKNSLISANTKGTVTAQNCSGGITDGGYNLDSAATCGFTAVGSEPNTDPLLDPAGLTNNGGPTLTIALQPGSPAVDRGNAGGNVTTDQRGVGRPDDLPSITNAAAGDGSDIGAFERQGGTVQFTAATQTVSEAAGTVTVTVSRSGGNAGSFSVQCSTADGTAKAAAAGAGTPDYTATQATLSWAEGDSADKTFTIAIANDSVFEPDETFAVYFSSAPGMNTVGAPATQTITIVNDDAEATPTPTATPTASPTASPTPTATPAPTATATPTPVPSPRQLLNIATRLRVQTGENVLIGGVIVTGTAPKKVLLRAIGPSLATAFDGALSDTRLELYDRDTLLAENDNWKDTQQAEIEATTIPPNDELESAIVYTLDPGFYTAIMSGKDGATGIGVIEVYDLDQAASSKLANISSRGFVQRGENVMIGGLIVGGNGTGTARILIRAIGPSLLNGGVSNALLDPTLELVDADGNVVRENDNWRDEQQAEIEATTIPPSDPAEAAIVVTLGSGNYTAVLRGKNGGVGVGLVEVYNVQ